MEGKSGWYMDWTTPNNSAPEQVFTAAAVRSSTTPTLTVSSSIVNSTSCTTTGAGYLNAMDAYHGGGLSDSYFDINRSGVTSDETFSSGTKTVGSIDFGVGTIGQAGFTGDNVIVQGSGVNTGTTTDNTADVGTKKYTKTSRRVSWREIVN
jgi:type IV pilus assembly protein PilY1